MAGAGGEPATAGGGRTLAEWLSEQGLLRGPLIYADYRAALPSRA